MLQCRTRARARAILRPEYMTRSTRINWHYGYDVVSLATVTRPAWRPPGASWRASLSRGSSRPLLRVFNTTVMHRDKTVYSH